MDVIQYSSSAVTAKSAASVRERASQPQPLACRRHPPEHQTWELAWFQRWIRMLVSQRVKDWLVALVSSASFRTCKNMKHFTIEARQLRCGKSILIPGSHLISAWISEWSTPPLHFHVEDEPRQGQRPQLWDAAKIILPGGLGAWGWSQEYSQQT